jgi:hypothetical protein
MTTVRDRFFTATTTDAATICSYNHRRGHNAPRAAGQRRSQQQPSPLASKQTPKTKKEAGPERAVHVINGGKASAIAELQHRGRVRCGLDRHGEAALRHIKSHLTRVTDLATAIV